MFKHSYFFILYYSDFNSIHALSYNFILSFRKSNSRHAKKERAKNSDHTVFLPCMAADLICTEKSQILLLLPMPFLFIS